MSASALPRKLTAASLSLLLVSCAATRPLMAAREPTGPRDLGRFVLVVQETPGGRVTHAWKPLEDVDLETYPAPLRKARLGGPLKRTSGPMSDEQIGDACFEVWERCMRRCKASPLPPHAEHYIASHKDVRAALEAYCTDACRKESDDCRRRLKRQAEEALEFRAIDEAVDWLKRHKEELTVGASVIIMGVVFYVVLSSGGVLILAPALLLASPEGSSESHVAEAFR
jgi:hypothetical protein